STKWRSLWQTPEATVRTSTSRPMGLSMSTFSIVSGWWGPWNTAAFMMTSSGIRAGWLAQTGNAPRLDVSSRRSAGPQALDSPAAAVAASATMLAYVGGYTSKDRDGRGDGINVYCVDEGSGAWSHVQRLGDLVNPSWLTLHRWRPVLYSAHGQEQEATAYSIDPGSGRLAVLNRQPTQGKNGVRLGIEASDRYLVCANYSSGTVAVLPIEPDGSLGALRDLVPLTGKTGPHPNEQTSAHPHAVAFDPRGRFCLIPDKGLDAIFVFRVDEGGKLVPGAPASVAARPGAGPRHAGFHPTAPFAFVLNELDSTLTAYRFDAETGALEPRQTLTTLPPGWNGRNTTSEIAVAPSGRFVYAS